MSIFENRDRLTKARDFNIGDVIKAYGGAFSTCIVINVTDDKVELFRPYGITADFVTSSGLIPYTGNETYSLFRNDDEYLVYHNTGPFKYEQTGRMVADVVNNVWSEGMSDKVWVEMALQRLHTRRRRNLPPPSMVQE